MALDGDAGLDALGRSSCLFLQGDPSASSGVYHPLGYQLRLAGDGITQHRLTHLHEIHHKVLNDDTSWGTAMHMCARHPVWAHALLPQLLAACRTTHEVFASFMSWSLLNARDGAGLEVLQEYPYYQALARRLQSFLHPVPIGHRQELAATGIARFCMSGPVLTRLIEVYPRTLRLADLRTRDHPDSRLAQVLRSGDREVERAVASADRASGLDVDQLALSSTGAALDEAWSTWEHAFVAALIAGSPTLSLLEVVDEGRQLVDARALADILGAAGIEIPLPHSDGEGPISDVESVQRLLNAVRIPLREKPFTGAVATLGEELGPAELIDLVRSTSGGRSHLILHGRPARVLTKQFRFSPGVRDYLLSTGSPVMAVRAPIAHDGHDAVLSMEIREPGDFAALAEAAGEGAVVASCLTASCFVDTEWQPQWWPVLRNYPAIVLVDCGLQALSGPGRLLGGDETVWGKYLTMESHPYLTGLIWHVDGHPHVMLGLGDDLTIQLLAGQLSDVLGSRLMMHDSDWAEWGDVLTAVISSLLGTENEIAFDGLSMSQMRLQPRRGKGTSTEPLADLAQLPARTYSLSNEPSTATLETSHDANRGYA